MSSILLGLATALVVTVFNPFVRAEEPRLLAVVTPAPEVLPRTLPTARSQTWTDNQCGRCHQVDALFSHPVNIIPSMHVPANLPLQDGKMTCVTCHESSAESHASARVANSDNLRTSSAATLCVQCHDQSQSTRKMRHALGLRKAHLVWPEAKKNAGSAAKSERAFDQQTQLCLSCHDGIMSSDVTMGTKGFSDALSEHPVGVSMAGLQSARSNPEPMMRAPATIDPRIKLIDNRVGCMSCHSPFSKESKLLVMSNRNSSLCLSCHGD